MLESIHTYHAIKVPFGKLSKDLPLSKGQIKAGKTAQDKPKRRLDAKVYMGLDFVYQYLQKFKLMDEAGQ
jgi:hypothetical protein